VFKKDIGFLSKLRDRLPVSRTEARRRAHKELIRAARVQVTKGVMLGMTHALAQKQEPLEQPELLWWKAQATKWEMIWQMVNEACKDLEDFQYLSRLGKVAEAAYRLQEQLAVDAAVALMEVPATTLHAESVRWRDTGMLISSLHRHCLMDKLEAATRAGKIPEESGITVVKEAEA
jgi:hypothetical protein